MTHCTKNLIAKECAFVSNHIAAQYKVYMKIVCPVFLFTPLNIISRRKKIANKLPIFLQNMLFLSLYIDECFCHTSVLLNGKYFYFLRLSQRISFGSFTRFSSSRINFDIHHLKHSHSTHTLDIKFGCRIFWFLFFELNFIYSHIF